MTPRNTRCTRKGPVLKTVYYSALYNKVENIGHCFGPNFNQLSQQSQQETDI